MIKIRPFERTNADYTRAVDIFNAVWVGQQVTVGEWIEGDEKRARSLRWGRFFAEVEGQLVGYGSYAQHLRFNHPGKLRVGVHVLPAFRRGGVGISLWRHLCREIEQYDPLRLFTSTKENHPEGIRFAERLGFVERLRNWESGLDLATIQLADWTGCFRRMAEQGIEIKSVVELKSDPKRHRKLYQLDWAIRREIPSSEPAAKESFEEFQKVWQRSNLVQDGWLVALEKGEYVGMTQVWSNQADPDLFEIGVTGVLPSHRRRGIATALKLRGIDFAQKSGIRELRTWSASNNEGILQVNSRLGFVRRPAHIAYVKEVRAERPEDGALTLVANAEGEVADEGAPLS